MRSTAVEGGMVVAVVVSGVVGVGVGVVRVVDARTIPTEGFESS